MRGSLGYCLACPQDYRRYLKISRRLSRKKPKPKPYQWLIIAAVVASGSDLNCLKADPEDLNRCLVLNVGGIDPPKSLSPEPIKSGSFLTTVEKVKLGFEIVGGTFSFLIVVLAVYYGVKRGDRIEVVLAGVVPFFAQLREIWRRHPRPQADLIDLWSIGWSVAISLLYLRPGPSLIKKGPSFF